MKKIILFILMPVFIAGIFYFLPEKKFKLPAKEIAKQTGINPTLANFVVNTKFGRKIGYLVVKKKVKKYIRKQENMITIKHP